MSALDESPPVRARGMDHLVLAVHDLEAARSCFAALGFTCTPRARHPWGTDNSLVQLDGFFLELLEVARPERIVEPLDGVFSFGAFNRDFLKTRQGLSMLVLESPDADADRTAFTGKGLRVFQPFEFSRTARGPAGEEAEVSFSLTFVEDPLAKAIGYFTCQHHAPQHFWKLEYQAHANGAVQIAEVVMVAADPRVHAGFLSSFFGLPAHQDPRGGIHLDSPRGRLSVLTPAAVEAEWGSAAEADVSGGPRLVACTLAVRDLDKAHGALEAGGIAHQAGDDRLTVGADTAFGVAIGFARS